MLRYVERSGLIDPDRTDAGYRLFGPAELQRLRTLRELLDEHGLSLQEVAFARRLQDDTELRRSLDGWFAAEAVRPIAIPAADWLRWEQDKHSKLLAAAARQANDLMETTTA